MSVPRYSISVTHRLDLNSSKLVDVAYNTRSPANSTFELDRKARSWQSRLFVLRFTLWQCVVDSETHLSWPAATIHACARHCWG
eukprot:2281235-Rhodomonas_salina.1